MPRNSQKSLGRFSNFCKNKKGGRRLEHKFQNPRTLWHFNRIIYLLQIIRYAGIRSIYSRICVYRQFEDFLCRGYWWRKLCIIIFFHLWFCLWRTEKTAWHDHAKNIICNMLRQGHHLCFWRFQLRWLCYRMWDVWFVIKWMGRTWWFSNKYCRTIRYYI